VNGRGIILTPLHFPPHHPPLTRAKKVEVLLFALDGVALGPFDVAVLRRLAGEPAATVRAVASLIARARVVGGWPPRTGGGGTV
jgi:hypothetical protein